MQDGYDIAQLCLNGHVINSMLKLNPRRMEDYCHTCGEKTITTCPNCETPIRGSYHHAHIAGVISYFPPSYCYNCGKPLPWTERRINAAVELIREEAKLNSEEEQQVAESIQDIVGDTPRTQLGATRFKRTIAKLGQHSAIAVRDILVDIVSETAKKIIWPTD